VRRRRRCRAYVVNYFDETVSMIDTATNKVAATINVGAYPGAIAITP
jgi:YVTN family beta-propeller protein